MVKTEDEIKRNCVAGCVRAFLEGKKTINWVMSSIKGHRLPKSILAEILSSTQPDAGRARYKELLSVCREKGLL